MRKDKRKVEVEDLWRKIKDNVVIAADTSEMGKRK